jgi:agmatinase
VTGFNTDGLKLWAGLPAPRPGSAPDARIFGVPLDRGSFYRKGAAQAPATLRELSAIFAPVTERAELFNEVTIEDCGDLPIVDGDMGANVEAISATIAKTPADTVPIVLGGDHTTVAPTLVAQQQRLNGRVAVLYIDAHPDLNDISRSSRWSNGCALRRGLELGEIDPRRVLLLGCRDYDWEEVEYIRQAGVTLIPSAEAHRLTPALFRERVQEVARDGRLHISLDIDALDPSAAPGTGIPAAGGLTSRELLDFLHALRGLPLAGLDVDEVAPPLDQGHVTSLAALRFIFEFLGALKLSR